MTLPLVPSFPRSLRSRRFARGRVVAGGAITAGNASQMSDGAAAVLLANEAGLRKLGAAGDKPLARVVALAVAANDPVLMLSAPIPATQKALAKAGLTLADIDLYEVSGGAEWWGAVRWSGVGSGVG